MIPLSSGLARAEEAETLRRYLAEHTCPDTSRETSQESHLHPYVYSRGQCTLHSQQLYIAILRSYALEKSLNTSTLPKEGIFTYAPPRPFDQLSSSNLLVTASFGHIIPNTFLSKFDPLHRLNVHPSLLPRYRGAAPIQWTIINGDTNTGVTVQTLVEKGRGIDGGDVLGRTSGVVSP